MAALFNIVALLALAVAQVLALPTVLRSEEEPLPVWQGFREAVLPGFSPRVLMSEMGYTLTKFKWSNCGKSTDPIKIERLEVYPNLTITVVVNVLELIEAPVKLDFSIAKKFGLIYIHVPCSMSPYPCSYSDACETWSTMMPECHPDIIANDLPCTCPVSPGRYTVSALDIDIPLFDRLKKPQQTIEIDLKKYLPEDTVPRGLINGDYKVEFSLTSPKKTRARTLLCTTISFSLHKNKG